MQQDSNRLAIFGDFIPEDCRFEGLYAQTKASLIEDSSGSVAMSNSSLSHFNTTALSLKETTSVSIVESVFESKA